MQESKKHLGGLGKAAGVAGLAIAGGLAVGLEKSVNAAMDAQKSQARLAQAFKTAGLNADKMEPQVKKLETASRKLGFTEDDVHNSLGSLIVATHSMSKASKDLSVAEDLARFKNISLTDATKMLTMAQTGSQRAVKQLGLNIPPVTTAQDALKQSTNQLKGTQFDLQEQIRQLKLHMDALKATHGKTTATSQKLKIVEDELAAVTAKLKLGHLEASGAAGQHALAMAKLSDKEATGSAIIDEVSRKLHGQSEAYSKTAAGSMEAFKAQLNFLEISLGTALLPLLAQVSTELAKATEFFTKHKEITKLLIIASAALAATLLTVSVATKVVTAATRIATAAQWAFNVALDANPIGAAIVAIAALSAALVVLQVKYQGVTKAVNFLKDHLYVLMAVPIVGWSAFIAAEIVKNWGKITAAAKALVAIFTGLPGQIADTFMAGIGKVKDAIVGLFHKVIGWVKGALGISSPSSVFVEIGKNVILGFVHGVGSMAGVLKKAVVGMVSSLPGKALGVVGKAAGALGGEITSAPGEHSYGSAEKYLVPWANEEGITVTSVAGGTHVPGSYHYMHRAIDVAGSAAQDRKFFADSIGHFGARNITELFYDPMGYFIKNGSRIAGAIGGHSDHVHIALAKGGIVTRPTLALVGEKGPEAVIPLNKARGGGGVTNLYFSFPHLVGSEREMEQLVHGALDTYSNRNGGLALGGGF